MPSKKLRLQFYADECFPLTSVTYLRSLGYSIIHAFDLKFIQKSDRFHLKESKKLNRILITLDRDFLYYTQVNIDDHPGIIVLSLSSMTPENVNSVCLKLLKQITPDIVKHSLIKVSKTKLIKEKQGEIILERKL